MRDGCHIFGNGKSSKTTKKNQHHKFPSGLGYPKPEGKDEGESYTLFRTSPPSSVPPPTAMAHPVPIAPCRPPFAASRPAPSCAPAPEQRRGGHISPTPPLPCRRGWGCCVWGDKTARLLRKSAQLLRETCRLFAQLPFIVLDAAHPADRACRTRVHTAGDNPNGKPAKNTLFPTFPFLAARSPRKIGTLCKSFAKTAVSPAISRAKTSEKTAQRGFSTGLSRPKRVKNGLKIINRR